MNLGDDFKYEGIDIKNLNLPSKWILSKLNRIIKTYDQFMDKYEFMEASKILYSFVWDDFASWYVEISKVDLQSNDLNNIKSTKNVLVYVLKAILKMLHPYTPFITETIYQELPHKHESITVSSWPKINMEFDFVKEEENVNDLISVVTSIRNTRALSNKPISEALTFNFYSLDSNFLKGTEKYLDKFINPKEMKFLDNDIKNQKEYHIQVLPKCKIYIPLDELVNKEEAIKKLNSDKAKLEAEIKRSESILNNESFLAKAPKAKVDIEKEKYEKYKIQYAELLKSLNELLN